MSKTIKVAVLLSGAGVYDGSELQESVLTLLSLSQRGIAYQCTAPNIEQHHVVNHTNGEEMDEKRNVLIESARIARGNIVPVAELDSNDYDALVIPGGFGAAKNLSKWAFKGPDGEVENSVKNCIQSFYEKKKPIVAMCMGPTTVAKALSPMTNGEVLTVGTTEEKSPYDIKGISEGIESLGAKVEMKTVEEVTVDSINKIISTPCYMMEAEVHQIYTGIEKAIDELKAML